jgi:hypothetical protein
MGILPALVCSAAAQEPCKLTAMGTEAVAGIRDGRTLSLADGRELRLAAIEVTDKSLSALQSLVEGRDVRLKQLSRERDRYERLWPTPISPPCSQKILPGLRLRGGQFVLVEGKVLSVRENGATICSNLGRRWTRDFIVTIPKRHRREFAAAGIDPNQLEGHPIRVRGWIEQHSGPVIEAAAPEQIELAQ